MTLKHAGFLSVAAAVALGVAACGGGGGASGTPGAGAQAAGYLPQSATSASTQTASASAAAMQPLPEPLIALGKPGSGPNLTAPIINDSGSYTNGAIIVGTNTTTGYGIEGVAEGVGAGVYGRSSYAGGSNSYGVYGASTSGTGVFGYAKTGGHGVAGVSSSGDAVVGTSTTGNGVVGTTAHPSNNGNYNLQESGVLGQDVSTDGGEADAGVAGTTINGFGVYGQAAGNGSGAGVEGIGFNRSIGIEGYVPYTSTGGVAVDAGNDSSGTGLFGNGDGMSAYSLNATAIVGEGGAKSSTTPVELLYTDNGQPFLIGKNGNTSTSYFSIDANGNMILAGNLTVDGTVTAHNTASCTSCTGPLLAHRAPAVEDTGDGRIGGGRGYVRLDPAFAAQLDASQSYNVFLTPYGDSKGLYVTGRTPSGFEVHENQNGRSSLSFGYRVVGVAKAGTVTAPIRTNASPPHHVARGIGPAAFKP